MIKQLTTEEFISLQLSENIPVIDVRSPGEYEHAHFPGAINVCILNNEERATIGITFKQEGRETVITKGFELVGHKFSEYINRAKEISPSKKIMVYCWRGGLRSNIMSWLFSLAGFKVYILNNGYKTFRQWALNKFSEKRNLVVIGGKTGSGKTELLSELKKTGEQVIDLEQIANHKGSAFGSLGMPPQPSNEMFENILAMEWHKTNPEKILWIENESRSIGKRILPETIYTAIRNAPLIETLLEKEIRKKRILNEYGKFPVEQLKEKTKRIEKRLGGLRLKQSLQFLEENNLDAWCEIMLDYYDKTYSHGNDERSEKNKIEIFFADDNMKQNAVLVKNRVTEKMMTSINR